MKSTNLQEKEVKAKGRFEIITYEAGTKNEIKPRIYSENLVMNNATSGLQLLLNKMGGFRSETIKIQWMRVGTGTTTPTDGDTGLTTPLTTGGQDGDGYFDITFVQDNGDSLIFECFMSDQDLPDGIYKEIGSYFTKGEIYSRSLFSTDFSKAAGEDKQVNYQLTFTN